MSEGLEGRRFLEGKATREKGPKFRPRRKNTKTDIDAREIYLVRIEGSRTGELQSDDLRGAGVGGRR